MTWDTLPLLQEKGIEQSNGFLHPSLKELGFIFLLLPHRPVFFLEERDSRLPICPAGLVTRVERSLLFENLNSLREIGSK
jgi:hypothetical protein